MRKILLTLMASLLSCSGAYAFWPEAADSSLEIGVGYRKDKLNWTTRADIVNSEKLGDLPEGTPQGFRSRLSWKNLRIWQVEAKGEYVTYDNIFLRASGSYGWIHRGKMADSDYFDYKATSAVEFSRSYARTRGHVYDADLALGYQFKLCDDSFSITPLIGYAWKGQHLKDRHLKIDERYQGEVLQAPDDVAGNLVRKHSSYSSSSDVSSDSHSSSSSVSHSSKRLNSRYNTRWNGPFIGAQFDYRFGYEWAFFADYQFHWSNYHAKAHWNLRTDIVDGRFHHRAKKAYGHVVDFGVKWDYSDCWTIALKGRYQYFHAKRGHDRTKVYHESVGDIQATAYIHSPLKDVHLHSASISLDLGVVF